MTRPGSHALEPLQVGLRGLNRFSSNGRYIFVCQGCCAGHSRIKCFLKCQDSTKRVFFCRLLPLSQHFNREMVSIRIDSLSMYFAEPDAICAVTPFLRRECEVVTRPPGAAAVMCAATPTIIDLSAVGAAPTVKMPHSGFEHRYPARFASKSTVGLLKSSLIYL